MRKFEYDRVWTDHEDFPTVETSEDIVRADLQYQPDKIRDFINEMIDALAAKTGAAEIGCADALGNDSTVAVQLAGLVAIKHALDRLLEAFNGITVEQELTEAVNKVPSAKAVSDAIAAVVIEAGAGDMVKRIYDPQGLAQDIFAYAVAAVTEHANRDNNPHRVTKEQVGLGNVENTRDIDKPISTAVQAALNTKYGEGAVIPVIAGGTGAETKAAARVNLGIRSGTAAPSGGSDGDIYIQYKA